MRPSRPTCALCGQPAHDERYHFASFQGAIEAWAHLVLDDARHMAAYRHDAAHACCLAAELYRRIAGQRAREGEHDSGPPIAMGGEG